MSFKERQSLEGKVAFITGGVGILGRELACGYAEMGASIIIADLNAEKVASFADDLSTKYGVEGIGVVCDVTDKSSVDSAVQLAYKKFGQIDVLNNNAGTKGSNVREFFAPFEEYSLDIWREVMAVNIDGMFLVAQSVGKVMLAQQSGSIIQTGSIYGLVGPVPSIYEGSEYLGGSINTPAVYSASKSAVVGFTRYLATYWGGANIKVNCLVPGGIESGQNDQFQSRYSEKVPLGRMAHADEIVSASIFLASDASSYITGQVLAVDGGWTAW